MPTLQVFKVFLKQMYHLSQDILTRIHLDLHQKPYIILLWDISKIYGR